MTVSPKGRPRAGIRCINGAEVSRRIYLLPWTRGFGVGTAHAFLYFEPSRSARFAFFARADLAVRGLAISFWTARSIALKDSSLVSSFI
jgi:hypothetical protein